MKSFHQTVRIPRSPLVTSLWPSLVSLTHSCHPATLGLGVDGGSGPHVWVPSSDPGPVTQQLLMVSTCFLKTWVPHLRSLPCGWVGPFPQELTKPGQRCLSPPPRACPAPRATSVAFSAVPCFHVLSLTLSLSVPGTLLPCNSASHLRRRGVEGKFR